jgi:hypothetical protein
MEINRLSSVTPSALNNPNSTLIAQRLRPSLDSILNNYQVSEDTMVQYNPDIFGIALDKSRDITATESKMLKNMNFIQLNSFKNIKDDAYATATNRISVNGELPKAVEAAINNLPKGIQERARSNWYKGDDGHTDAFRHAYWSARMTYEFGEEWAKQFATAHEAVPESVNKSAAREAMDLYNNKIGRDIARLNPDISLSELADKVERVLNSGKLVVINDQGNLDWSDNVARSNHGTAASGSLPGEISIPDGDVRAE